MNRWENSDYYLRNYSPLLQLGVPRVQRFDFSIADMVSSFSTPIQLIPAQQGFLILPLWNVLMRKESFNTQASSIVLHWLLPGAAGQATGWGVTCLTAATTNGRFAVFNGAPAHAALNGSDAVTAFGSKPLYMWAATANPTVSAANPGSIVSIVLAWILLPTYPESVGGPITPHP